MRRRLILIIAVLLVIVGSQYKKAEAQFFKVGLGPHYSYITLMDSEERQKFAGGQLRMKFLSTVGLEISIDYRKDLYVEDTFRVQSIPALISVLVYVFPGRTFSPYLLGGGGWYYNHVTFLVEPFKEYSGNVDFGYHFGGGVELSIVGKVGFHLDYRSIMVNFSPLNLKGDGHLITAGMTYYF
jgi:opacity protein-like surface antigen